ncbi:integrase core domain-containing protein [Sphingomonas lycopersici]|uniref:integrase core domain-containing protein n=1 Tax=Sphingomonas lycopersici TaxID=2951807 RepID=UPI002238724B|nr:integrase core domain-containing protein [Sphingomonas lycopersici]
MHCILLLTKPPYETARSGRRPSHNALAETINGLYKAEVIWRQRSWPSVSAVEMATLRWVDWFNHHRLFGPIGHIPPAEAEANYYAAINNLDMVA